VVDGGMDERRLMPVDARVRTRASLVPAGVAALRRALCALPNVGGSDHGEAALPVLAGSLPTQPSPGPHPPCPCPVFFVLASLGGALESDAAVEKFLGWMGWQSMAYSAWESTMFIAALTYLLYLFRERLSQAR